MKKVLACCLLILSATMFGLQSSKARVTLVLGAYTTPKEVYKEKLIPAFKRYW